MIRLRLGLVAAAALTEKGTLNDGCQVGASAHLPVGLVLQQVLDHPVPCGGKLEQRPGKPLISCYQLQTLLCVCML